MADLTPTGVRVVHEVGARGSFTAAAGALGYTQSAVSRQVTLAEQAVGAKLFERGSRGVRPTQRGELLLRRVKAILAHVDAAMLEQDQLGEPSSERLTLGAFPTALAALVPQALARVRAEHPALEVRIREGGTEAQLRRLRAGRIDVGVIAAGVGLDLEDLEFDRLLLGQAHLIVSAEHRFAERGWVNVADLEDEHWIVGEADRSCPQFGAWPTLAREPNIVYTLRDWPGRFGLVAAGLGVAVIPSLLLPTLPPGIRALRVEDPQPFRREVLGVTRPDRTPSTPNGDRRAAPRSRATRQLAMSRPDEFTVPRALSLKIRIGSRGTGTPPHPHAVRIRFIARATSASLAIRTARLSGRPRCL